LAARDPMLGLECTAAGWFGVQMKRRFAASRNTRPCRPGRVWTPSQVVRWPLRARRRRALHHLPSLLHLVGGGRVAATRASARCLGWDLTPRAPPWRRSRLPGAQRDFHTWPSMPPERKIGRIPTFPVHTEFPVEPDMSPYSDVSVVRREGRKRAPAGKWPSRADKGEPEPVISREALPRKRPKELGVWSALRPHRTGRQALCACRGGP